MHLHEAFENLLAFVHNSSQTSAHAALKELKEPSNPKCLVPFYGELINICTNTAADLIWDQYGKYKNGSFEIMVNSGSFVVSCSGVSHIVDQGVLDCSCSFRKQYALPCQHLFAVRQGLKRDLFEEKMVDERWRKINLQKFNFKSFVSSGESSVSAVPKSSSQKFVNARIYTDKLASLLSQSSDNEFKGKLNIIQELIRAWECNEDVVLCQKENAVFVPFISDLVKRRHSKTESQDQKELPYNGDNEVGKKYIVNTESNSGEIENNLDMNSECLFEAPKAEKRLCSNIVGLNNFSVDSLVVPHVKCGRGRPKNNKKSSFKCAAKKHDAKDKLSEPRCNVLNSLKKITEATDFRSWLMFSDIQDLISHNMLTDNVINVGQELIKLRYPNVVGLQNVLLGSHLNFQKLYSPFVQILHCGRQAHWILVSTINAPPSTVYVYDSINQDVPVDSIPQICNLMNVSSDYLNVIVKPVQIQSNSVDCGLFALANALTLLNDSDPTKVVYHEEKMRSHFISCILNRDFSNFPVLNLLQVPRALERHQHIPVCLMCRQSHLLNFFGSNFKALYQCGYCKCWYHEHCKMFHENFSSQKLCSQECYSEILNFNNN